ncbi:Hypothetical predicted protein [Octopus vulgaris]|uniref:Uncharacterized protein n=1 Tax=Octopus vulgaris TaxID=6645 RepID=A0AA36C115_OCTVU|nr:Hypothetical predicted protein [Octopus vulgaris]
MAFTQALPEVLYKSYWTLDADSGFQFRHKTNIFEEEKLDEVKILLLEEELRKHQQRKFLPRTTSGTIRRTPERPNYDDRFPAIPTRPDWCQVLQRREVRWPPPFGNAFLRHREQPPEPTHVHAGATEHYQKPAGDQRQPIARARSPKV